MQNEKRTDSRVANGLPDIETKSTYSLVMRLYQDHTESQRKEDEVQPTLALIIMAIINMLCMMIFVPTNCIITRGFLHISTKNQPMFLFFVGVQVLCLIDLLVCFFDVVLYWVHAPNWICWILGGKSMATYCYLTLLIASICFYR